MNKKKHDFDHIATMVSNNGKGIIICPDMLDLNRNKKGGRVTFGIPDPYFDQLIQSTGGNDKKFMAMVLIVDMEEFNKVKNENN